MQYAAVPLAFSINNFGIDRTQRIIDEIERENSSMKFYVCQHIQVGLLNFGENIVFTPHTVESDRYNFIPHYNPVYSIRPSAIKQTHERPWDFSFVGDFNTNSIRSRIGRASIKNCIVEPTGKWFFSHDSRTQANLKKRYVSVLEDTKFPLCPEGTGPSTLRLFETFSSGGFPVIFNDIKLPIDLKKFICKTTIESLENGTAILECKNFDESQQQELLDLYWEKYSNNNLSRSIIDFMKGRCK